MDNVAWGSRLLARDRCVLYFPRRSKDRIIMGEEATRRRWGERWYQVRIEPVTAEIRLEGDNAIDLGRGLCCDAVAKLDAQIDTAKDLEQSIAKIVKHFICVPTNDRDLILGQAAFGEPLKNVLRSMMKNVIGIVSYREMLDNPDCIVKLQEELKKQMGDYLHASGLQMLDCSLRVKPLKPTVSGWEPEIARRWMDWEIAQLELDKEIKRRTSALEDDDKRETRLQKEKTEKAIRQIELRELKALTDYEKEKVAEQTEQEKNKQQGSVDVAKAGESAEVYFRKRREELLQFKAAEEQKRQEAEQKTALGELENASALKSRELELERVRASEETASKIEIQKKELEAAEALKLYQLDMEAARFAKETTLDAEKKQRELEDSRKQSEILKARSEMAELQRDTAILQIEIEKIRGLAEAEVVRAKCEAALAGEQESMRELLKVLADMQTKLPEILKSIPAARSGETTLIQVGTNGTDSDVLSNSASILGLVYLPIVKQVLDRFTANWKTGVADGDATGIR